MKALHFVVTGRVQGVWFRAWTEETARALGVTGWVRNRPDGRVEGRAEGDEASLSSFVERLHEGSPSAQVASVEVSEVAPEGSAAFTIRR